MTINREKYLKKLYKLFENIKKFVLELVILIIFCIALSAVLVIGVPIASSWWNKITSLPIDFAVKIISLISTVITVIVGPILIHGFGKDTRKRKRRFLKNRDEIYIEAASIAANILRNQIQGEKRAEDELINRINEFESKLIIWGSADLIKAWGGWKQSSQSDSQNGEKLEKELVKIIFCCRENMGQNSRLENEDVINCFLDFDIVKTEKQSQDCNAKSSRKVKKK